MTYLQLSPLYLGVHDTTVTLNAPSPEESTVVAGPSGQSVAGTPSVTGRWNSFVYV